MIAFAEVASFVRFFVKSTGDDALAELLVRIRVRPTTKEYVDEALRGRHRRVARRLECSLGLPTWGRSNTSSRRGQPGRRRAPREPKFGGVWSWVSSCADARTLEPPRRSLGTRPEARPLRPPSAAPTRLRPLRAGGGRPRRKSSFPAWKTCIPSLGPGCRSTASGSCHRGRTDEAGAAFRPVWSSARSTPRWRAKGKCRPKLPESPNKAPLCQAARSVLQD